jgi:hypothetical protein
MSRLAKACAWPAVALAVLLASCGQPHRAGPEPSVQTYPEMTRRVFRGADPELALHAAGWTLADLGFAVMAVRPEDGVLHAKQVELFGCGANIQVTRHEADAVLVEITIDWPYGHRIADPDFYESFFVPLGRTMRRTPEPVPASPAR